MWTVMEITVIVRDDGGKSDRDSGDAHGNGFTGDEDLSIHYWTNKKGR